MHLIAFIATAEWLGAPSTSEQLELTQANASSLPYDIEPQTLVIQQTGYQPSPPDISGECMFFQHPLCCRCTPSW